MNEFVREIASLVITVAILLVCTVCAVVVCVLCCLPCDTCPQRLLARQHERDEESTSQQNGLETVESRSTQLSESPPPAYRNVSQYRNVDMEHDEVVRLRSMYRLSSHMESETLSLPPDYISTQGEDETTERLSRSVAPQEMQVEGGQLPPTYSTAQLELMARRTVTEDENL